MKTLLFPACLALGTAGLLGGCGRDPAPTGPALSAPTSASPTASPGPATRSPGASDTPPMAAPVPSGTPTAEQQAQVKTAAASLQANFDAGRNLAAQAYAHELAQWQAKRDAYEKTRKAYDDACRALQQKMADPALTPAQREELAQTPLPAVPDDVSPTPPVPPNGDPQANVSFDALIYQFRQAVAARDHARVAVVMAKMTELAPKISPSLMATYRADAQGYFQKYSESFSAPATATTENAPNP